MPSFHKEVKQRFLEKTTTYAQEKAVKVSVQSLRLRSLKRADKVVSKTFDKYD
jgi:hypothetical protein